MCQKSTEMLPDERALIAERGPDLDDLDEDEYLTTDELADRLNIDLDRDDIPGSE